MIIIIKHLVILIRILINLTRNLWLIYFLAEIIFRNKFFTVFLI